MFAMIAWLINCLLKVMMRPPATLSHVTVDSAGRDINCLPTSRAHSHAAESPLPHASTLTSYLWYLLRPGPSTAVEVTQKGSLEERYVYVEMSSVLPMAGTQDPTHWAPLSSGLGPDLSMIDEESLARPRTGCTQN